MNKINYIYILLSLSLVSCFDSSKPNYQFFPNMYESVGYDTYAESSAFANGIEDIREPIRVWWICVITNVFRTLKPTN